MRSKTVLVIAGLRTLFIVTFFLTAFNVGPPWDSTWFKFLDLILLAVSNGYISPLACIKASDYVTGDMKAQVGSFVGITLTTGIVIGSIFALGFGQILDLRENPPFYG